jgi:cation:H+ antiporter
VLGLGSIVAPAGIPVSQGALTFDIPVMIAVAIAALPVLLTGHTVARWEAAVFLSYYVATTSYLILSAADHGLAPQLGAAIIWFVAPITVLTVAASLVRHRRTVTATR